MTPKPNRLSSCHRHPSIPLTGFCASCLRERLAGIQSPSAADHHPPPHLRRTKSFSGSRDSPSPSSSSFAVTSQPRRRSCEVRSLSDLFSVDDHQRRMKKNRPSREVRLESESSGFEMRGEVRVCGGSDREDDEETKTMKEFIDLELRSRKSAARDLRSFWESASSLSDRLRNWRRKHKSKKRRSFGGNGNENGRRLTETQSEIGEYGLGRRSCDTDPRLSIDASRGISVDNCSHDPYPRFSIDGGLISVDVGRISVGNDSRDVLVAPRASWDGCLIGKQRHNHKLSPMVSVVEDDAIANDSAPVEENSNAGSGGASFQAKDYCRHRTSFDRSSSYRRQQSPATAELFYGANMLITEKDLDLRDENAKPLSDVRDDCAAMGSASKDSPDVVSTGGKYRKWRGLWSKLGFAVPRREADKLRVGEAVVNKPLAESWQKLRRVVNVQASSESVSQKLIRSYSVSCRNSCKMAGLVSSLGSEIKGNVLNGRQEIAIRRNRSVRYSPNNLDNGLLRFYLAPLKSYRRSKSGRSSIKDLQPIARSFF